MSRYSPQLQDALQDLDLAIFADRTRHSGPAMSREILRAAARVLQYGPRPLGTLPEPGRSRRMSRVRSQQRALAHRLGLRLRRPALDPAIAGIFRAWFVRRLDQRLFSQLARILDPQWKRVPDPSTSWILPEAVEKNV